MYLLMISGSCMYLSLWAYGQYTIKSVIAKVDGEELNEGRKEMQPFVESQLDRKPRASMDRGKMGPPGPEWGTRIEEWNKCKDAYEKVIQPSQDAKDRRKIYIRLLSFAVLVFWMWLCMFFIAPSGSGLFRSYNTFMQGFLTAWNFKAAPIGWLFLGSSIMETFLFCVASFLIAWPAANNKQGICVHGNKKEECDKCAEFHGTDRKVSSLASQSNDTCLLIACHNSCINAKMRKDFLKTLSNALELFPPECIVVCDNGQTKHPADDTQGYMESICNDRFGKSDKRRMHYVYVPEGNKTHALYWVSEWWIPLLVQKDKLIDFKYLVMIDDDVPLPENFDFHYAELEADPSIVCCGHGITAARPFDPKRKKSRFSILVALQDMEYKISGFFKYFQYLYAGSAFYAHGAVSLWRRKVLGQEILYKHDTEFNGEDMYMGLLTARLSERSENKLKIAFSIGNLVETYAPDSLGLLFKQRARSWDLGVQRKIKTTVKEMCFRWKHQHIMLKIFHASEMITLFLDWLRLFMLALILPTSPIVVLGITAFFMGIAYTLLFIFRFIVLRNRADLRDKIPISVFILFPIYKVTSWLIATALT